MRHTELWARLEAALGSDYYRHWASTQVLGGLGGRTVTEAERVYDLGWASTGFSTVVELLVDLVGAGA